MAHQTGIKGTDELHQLLAVALKGSVRLLKVVIRNETLEAVTDLPPNKDWEGDFDAYVPDSVDENDPCYIFYRLDEKNGSGSYVWLFIAYTPDTAQVRDKMLYAATQATMKQEFGGGLIKEEMTASIKKDVTLAGYYSHKETVDAPPPLTEAEQILQDIHLSEQVMRNSENKQSHMSGVSFPFKKNAEDAVASLHRKSVAYVQLALDIKMEQVALDRTETILDLAQLPDITPKDSPRYHLIYFPHTYDGDNYDSVVFLYTCPGYSCSVKERMLYSSCKAEVTNTCEQQFGVTIARKVETDDVKEVTRDYLISELHPKVTAYKPKFEKPKPPGRNTKRTSKASSPL